MPIAKPDHARTLRGVPVVIAVIANDEGSNLSIAGYTQPPTGTLVLNPDQSFTYTPASGFAGSDGFAYTVRDRLGGTAQGEVTIVVARPNSPPTATSDTASAITGGSIEIPVLANDDDPEGDPLDIIGVDAPAHGTIQVQADQSIRYTPQAGFDGIDSFTYTVGDGAGAISTANVTVAVALPNAPPRAVPDQATTIEGTAVTIDALANDNDPEGGEVSLAGMTLPGHGGLSLTPDRRFVYTPTEGFVGPDSFSYSIRDDQGASATGLVTVEVARQNAPPVVIADSAVTTGQPVIVDPLANDNDPDGDPLRLTALTLPIKGRIALNPDGKVTYTPPTGFTGQDGFTYQVSDGTAVSEGEIAVSVTAPAISTYANGFRYRRRIVVPAQATAIETAADFVLLARETGPWLKQLAAGGRIQHPQAFDLRFELENGTKLDHELERYDASAGSVLAWVRVPAWELSSHLRIVLYYGKPGLTAAEANPAAVWRGYLAVLDARTGADRSASNRAFTPSGIGTGTLLGDAGAYSGASVASRSDAAFLSGKNALTVQALVAPDAATLGSSHGVLAQGPMNGTDASAGLTLQYLAQGADGTRNPIHFKVTCSDGAAFVVSGADAQRAAPQLLHGVWRQGETARLFLDGTELQASASSAPRAGTTAMPAGGLYLGAGARDPVTGGWRGLIDEVRFAETAFSPARIASEARNLSANQALYGLGGEDEAGQSDAAPVAVPLAVVVTAGNSIDIDVAASAYDPDGPGLPEVVGAAAPANGVVTVVGGRCRYTPFGGFVGQDQFRYTLDNAGKRSSSSVSVRVDEISSADRPKHPPVAVRTLRVPEDYATFALAYAAARAGDHISLASGSYAGNINLNRSFPNATPVVIRSRSPHGAILSGAVNVDGGGHWLYELKLTRPSLGRQIGAVMLNADYFTATRCWFDSPGGIISNTASRGHAWIGWNRFTARNTVQAGGQGQIYFAQPDGGAWRNEVDGPHDIEIYRNFFHAQHVFSEEWTIYFGDTKVKNSDIRFMRNVNISYNLLGSSTRPRGIYVKRGANLRYNQIMDSGSAMVCRHGAGGEVWGNRLAGDLTIVDGYSDSFHDIRGNVVGGSIEVHCAHLSPAQNEYQAADYALLVGNTCTNGIALGYKPSNHELWSLHGGKTSQVRVYTAGRMSTSAVRNPAATCDASTNTISSGDGGFSIPTTITLTQQDVGLEIADQAA